MVFTLVVVPGTGDSVARTDPFCAVRPESGTWLARVACPNEKVARLVAVRNIAKARFCSRFSHRLLAELLSKTPNTQGTQHERNREQTQEIRPEIRKTAALQHASASDDREVVDRVDHRERL